MADTKAEARGGDTRGAEGWRKRSESEHVAEFVNEETFYFIRGLTKHQKHADATLTK